LLIHNHKYQANEVLILERVNLDKDCKTWK